MKTPREILLESHQQAVPELDAIRETILKTQNSNPENRTPSGLLLKIAFALWRELVLPSRRVWAGMTAVWLLLLAINVSQRDTMSSATGQPAPPRALIMSWQMQQRWMNELLADHLTAPDSDRPRRAAAKPRTEVRETAAV